MANLKNTGLAKNSNTNTANKNQTNLGNEATSELGNKQTSNLTGKGGKELTSLLTPYQPTKEDWEGAKEIKNQNDLNVSIPSFISEGIDNYILFEKLINKKKIEKKDLVAEALDAYLKQKYIIK